MARIEIGSDGEVTDFDQSRGGSDVRETWRGPEMGIQPSREQREQYNDWYDRQYRQTRIVEVETPFNSNADVHKRREQAIIGSILPKTGHSSPSKKAPLPN